MAEVTQGQEQALSVEELGQCLQALEHHHTTTPFGDTREASRKLRRHIAGLENRLAVPPLAAVEDAALRLERATASFGERFGESLRGCIGLLRDAARLAPELAADNAELLTALRSTAIDSRTLEGCWCPASFADAEHPHGEACLKLRVLLTRPHPGAALLERLRATEAERDTLKMNNAGMAKEWKEKEAERAQAAAAVRLAFAKRDDVWLWMGDGNDKPETLLADHPVVMAASTAAELMKAPAELAAALKRVEALEQGNAELRGEVAHLQEKRTEAAQVEELIRLRLGELGRRNVELQQEAKTQLDAAIRETRRAEAAEQRAAEQDGRTAEVEERLRVTQSSLDGCTRRVAWLAGAIRKALDAYTLTAPPPMLRDLSEALRSKASAPPAGLVAAVGRIAPFLRVARSMERVALEGLESVGVAELRGTDAAAVLEAFDATTLAEARGDTLEMLADLLGSNMNADALADAVRGLQVKAEEADALKEQVATLGAQLAEERQEHQNLAARHAAALRREEAVSNDLELMGVSSMETLSDDFAQLRKERDTATTAIGNALVYLRQLAMGGSRMDYEGEAALVSDLDDVLKGVPTRAPELRAAAAPFLAFADRIDDVEKHRTGKPDASVANICGDFGHTAELTVRDFRRLRDAINAAPAVVSDADLQELVMDGQKLRDAARPFVEVLRECLRTLNSLGLRGPKRGTRWVSLPMMPDAVCIALVDAVDGLPRPLGTAERYSPTWQPPEGCPPLGTVDGDFMAVRNGLLRSEGAPDYNTAFHALLRLALSRREQEAGGVEESSPALAACRPAGISHERTRQALTGAYLVLDETDDEERTRWAAVLRGMEAALLEDQQASAVPFTKETFEQWREHLAEMGYSLELYVRPSADEAAQAPEFIEESRRRGAWACDCQAAAADMRSRVKAELLRIRAPWDAVQAVDAVPVETKGGPRG